MMKKIYLKPEILTQEIDAQSIMEGSTKEVVVDPDKQITDPNDLGAKSNNVSHYSVWDD